MTFEEFLKFRDVNIKNAAHERVVRLFFGYAYSVTGNRRLYPDLFGRLLNIDTSNLTVPTGCFNGIFDGTVPPYPDVDFYVKLSDQTRIFVYGKMPNTPLVELPQNHYAIFVLSNTLTDPPKPLAPRTIAIVPS